MRKYAFVKKPNEIKWVMIYEEPYEVYLFLYISTADCGCDNDLLFRTPEEAEKFAAEEYEISQSDWIQIDDPLPYCQHDIIRPVRVRGREQGNPQFEFLEELKDGIWIPFKETHE